MSVINRAAAAVITSGQFDDGLVTKYEISPTGTYLQYNGIGRAGIRFETGSPVRFVTVTGRKYGLDHKEKSIKK